MVIALSNSGLNLFVCYYFLNNKNLQVVKYLNLNIFLVDFGLLIYKTFLFIILVFI